MKPQSLIWALLQKYNSALLSGLLAQSRRELMPSQVCTWISSHLMSFSTSPWLRRMNSSCCTTSGKCFWLKTSAACIRSTQLWVSAKSLIPRQLEGSSWLSKNSQQACFTPRTDRNSESLRTLGQVDGPIFLDHNITLYQRNPGSTPKNQVRNFMLWKFKSYFCLMCCVAFCKDFPNVCCCIRTSTARRIASMDTTTIKQACLQNSWEASYKINLI